MCVHRRRVNALGPLLSGLPSLVLFLLQPRKRPRRSVDP